MGTCYRLISRQQKLVNVSVSASGLQRRQTAPSLVNAVLRSPGQSLDAATRVYMEPRFGHDFSHVRVHTDQWAAESAAEVSALAYTVGSDIVMGAGQYHPHTGAGRRLLAHELIHVVQQAAGVSPPTLARQPIGSASQDDNEAQAQQVSNELSPADTEDDRVTTEDAPPQQAPASTCPITAVFSSFVVGQEKANCQVPTGKFGIARLARFHLTGLPATGGSVTIGEQFSLVDESPPGLFSVLKPNSYTTNGTIFDDCYSMYSSNPLPDDFHLKVIQNHLLGGNVISKNQITYEPGWVRFCHYDRIPGKCDFGNRCRL